MRKYYNVYNDDWESDMMLARVLEGGKYTVDGHEYTICEGRLMLIDTSRSFGCLEPAAPYFIDLFDMPYRVFVN